MIRHKVFMSYHHADQTEVARFVDTFDRERNVFIARALGVGMARDIIESDDATYVMRRIRELYLEDSTVTIVLLGRCTWARRYVDWELQASLRHGRRTVPNGLLGISLPSAGKPPRLPTRLRINLPPTAGAGGYARWYPYPASSQQLGRAIEDAYKARTDAARLRLITNQRERRMRSATCGAHR